MQCMCFIQLLAVLYHDKMHEHLFSLSVAVIKYGLMTTSVLWD